MVYINIKNNGQVETIDQFETHKEDIAMLAEYRFGDPSNYYYLSTRSTKEWRIAQ